MLGIEGWLGLLHARHLLGSTGIFIQSTARTPRRALWDVRWGTTALWAERALVFWSAVSFYPQLW